MKFPSEETLHAVAHDITMEFLRRNAPPPLPRGTSYALDTATRVNSLVNEYLNAYQKIVARLREE